MWINVYINPDLNYVSFLDEYQNELVGNICIFTNDIEISEVVKLDVKQTVVFCNQKYELFRKSIILEIEHCGKDYQYLKLYKKTGLKKLIMYENTLNIHLVLDDLLSKL